MRELGWFLLGFVVGAVAGWAAVIAAYAAYVEVFNVFDRDGGGAMAAVVAIGPMVGLITGLVTAVQVALRRKRRADAPLARLGARIGGDGAAGRRGLSRSGLRVLADRTAPFRELVVGLRGVAAAAGGGADGSRARAPRGTAPTGRRLSDATLQLGRDRLCARRCGGWAALVFGWIAYGESTAAAVCCAFGAVLGFLGGFVVAVMVMRIVMPALYMPENASAPLHLLPVAIAPATAIPAGWRGLRTRAA